MRKYLLPLTVCAVLGVLVIVLVKMGGDDPTPDRTAKETSPEAKQAPIPTQPGRPGRKTPTPLERHRFLSELERAMQREDLSHAHFFRQKICEDLDTILKDKQLTANLLQLIRDNASSDDPRRRDVVLPMLRVIQHPEATRMVEEYYYQARDEEEQMTLLEAMTHDYHDPKKAAGWVIEKCLNSENKEHRDHALDCLVQFSRDDPLVVDTGLQIYESSTRRDLKDAALEVVTNRGYLVPRVQDFVRAKLRNPRMDELDRVLNSIESWGDERDAATIERLAEEFPAMADHLKEKARMVRETIRALAVGKATTPEERARLQREEEAELERRAQEIGGGTEPGVVETPPDGG